MARYKPYNYDQKVLLPVCLDEQLVEGTLEWAIHHIVEDYMDLSVFARKYRNDETGSPAYDPKVLLKVVLFAYSRGINTSRPIERLCRENVVFMALWHAGTILTTARSQHLYQAWSRKLVCYSPTY